MSENRGGSTTDHLKVGRRGEALAARYLRDRGWSIISKRFETKYGEIDIVARRPVADGRGAMVAFVEVKTRSSPGRMAPELAVTAAKRRRLSKMGRVYADRHGRSREGYRFDVIGVDFGCSPPEIRHFEGAFDASGRPY